MAIWVAVGGRGTLVGADPRQPRRQRGKSWLTVALPERWLYVLGALFIAVTLFCPMG